MKKPTITPKARADLKDISRYTDKKWGRQQRFNYIKQLKDRFSYLAKKPQMGRKRDEIIGSPYSYHEGRHVISNH
jgi:toxin ParE1/3/4